MSKYKLGLIYPKSSFYFRDEAKSALIENMPGFDVYVNYWTGLGAALPTLASLTDDDFDVEIIDENVENIDLKMGFDLVGISAMTHQALRAYAICDEFRKKGACVVIGGIHPTVLPHEAKEHADAVVIGEAENIWPELLKDFKKGAIKPFYDQKDHPPVDLSTLPVPRYDLLKGKNYKIIWFNTERGCPYDCEFCSVSNIFGTKNRHKKIEQVGSEITFIKNKFPKVFIGFSDNNMFLNRKFSKELLTSFKELNFRWVAQSDITVGDDDAFLKLLFEAGCHVLFIGLESLDMDNLDKLYVKGRKLKKDYLSRYKDLIHKIQSHGIGVFGSFIIGLDGDTKDTFSKISDFVRETNMLSATINVLTPLPGTRLRGRLIKEGRLLNTAWDNYTFWDVNFVPAKMTGAEIEDGLIKAYERIYSKDRMKLTAAYFKDIFKKMN